MPDYRLAARRAAKKYGVDPVIFERQIAAESGYAEDVIRGRRRSSAGAQGIAQFMPATARAYGVTLGDNRVTDDLEGAARYMRDNLRRTGGNYHRALSIYNSGRPEGYKTIGETRAYVSKILDGVNRARGRGTGGGSTSAAPSSGSRMETRTRTEQTFDEKGFEQAQRKQLLAQLLAQRRGPQGSVLLRTGAISTAPVDRTQFQGTKQVTERVRVPGSSGSGAAAVKASAVKASAGSDTATLVSRANAIDRKRLPYKWGGGHAGRVNAYDAKPLDCSGAVSAVLGINPRVSGQFEQFGKPGDGGNRGVTIYANSKHVLMKINGHFFGTSATNPGGGAGWIKQKDISPEYLKGFTARHLPR